MQMMLSKIAKGRVYFNANSTRFYATSNNSSIAQAQTESVKQSKGEIQKSGKVKFLIDLIPGGNIASKTGLTASIAGIFTYLTQTGIYIPNEDTFALAGFALFARVFYMKLGQPISDFLGNEIIQMRDSLIGQKTSLEKEAENDLLVLEQFRDHADVTSALYNMKAENVKLEAEVAQLTEKVQFFQSIRGKLNEMVSKEKQRQEAERKAYNMEVRQALINLLAKPDIQNKIMNQCLANLEKLPINRI